LQICYDAHVPRNFFVPRSIQAVLRFTEDILHNRVRWDSRLDVVLTSLLVLAVYLLLTSREVAGANGGAHAAGTATTPRKPA
jgi:hypothetical protein